MSDHRPTAGLQFDTTPLTEPVSAEELRRFRQDANARPGQAWRDISLVPGLLVVGLVGLFLGGTLFLVVAGRTESLLMGLIVGVAVAVVEFALGISFIRYTRSTETWTRRLRLVRFAERNRLGLSQRAEAPDYPGLLFIAGERRRVSENLFGSGAFADCGSYSFHAAAIGERGSTQYWQFAVLRLPGRLPHMIVDARANNAIDHDLPVKLDKLQEVPLGGELGRRYALHVPAGYGPDAYYVFTPDLLALLLDETTTMDVEIIEDHLFLYSKQGLEVEDPATWRRLEAISSTIARIIGDRARSYRDHRSVTWETRPVGQSGWPAPAAPGRAAADPGPTPVGRAGSGPTDAWPPNRQQPVPPGTVFTPPPVPQVAPQGRRIAVRRRVVWSTVVGMVLVGVVALVAVIGG